MSGFPHTVGETVAWVRNLGPSFERYAEHFLQNDITGDMLLGLGHSDLKSIGIQAAFHRKRILESIEELKFRFKSRTEYSYAPSVATVKTDTEPQQVPLQQVFDAETAVAEISGLSGDMVYIDKAIQTQIFKLIVDYLKCLRCTFRLAQKPAKPDASVHSVTSYDGNSSLYPRILSQGTTLDNIQVQKILEQISAKIHMKWGSAEDAYQSLDKHRCGFVSLAQLRVGLEQNGVPAEMLNNANILQYFAQRFPERLITLESFVELFPTPRDAFRFHHASIPRTRHKSFQRTPSVASEKLTYSRSSRFQRRGDPTINGGGARRERKYSLSSRNIARGIDLDSRSGSQHFRPSPSPQFDSNRSSHQFAPSPSPQFDCISNAYPNQQVNNNNLSANISMNQVSTPNLNLPQTNVQQQKSNPCDIKQHQQQQQQNNNAIHNNTFNYQNNIHNQNQNQQQQQQQNLSNYSKRFSGGNSNPQLISSSSQNRGVSPNNNININSGGVSSNFNNINTLAGGQTNINNEIASSSIDQPSYIRDKSNSMSFGSFAGSKENEDEKSAEKIGLKQRPYIRKNLFHCSEQTNTNHLEPLEKLICVMKQINKPVTELFRIFKSTSGSQVTAFSLVESMKNFGVEISEAGGVSIIDAYDKNGDKTLRQVEWEAFCSSVLGQSYINQFAPRPTHSNIHMEGNSKNLLVEVTTTLLNSPDGSSLTRLFKKMCVGGGRRMTSEDMVEALKSYGIHLGQQDICEIIKPFDRTSSGSLSRAEFVRFINCGKSV